MTHIKGPDHGYGRFLNIFVLGYLKGTPNDASSRTKPQTGMGSPFLLIEGISGRVSGRSNSSWRDPVCELPWQRGRVFLFRGSRRNTHRPRGILGP